MTNSEIIYNNSIELMKNGIIAGSGVFGEMVTVDADGNETKQVVELPEVIHTFAGWKAAGYIVRKGEKAKASFSIWKYKAGKEAVEATDDAEAQEATASRMFLTKAFFFTAAQVDKITK